MSLERDPAALSNLDTCYLFVGFSLTEIDRKMLSLKFKLEPMS